MPVFRDSLDNPIGMVHIKDAMAWATRSEREPASNAPRSAEFLANLDFGSAKLNATHRRKPASSARRFSFRHRCRR